MVHMLPSIAFLIALVQLAQPEPIRVGPAGDATVVPTSQLLRPAGRTVEFPSRPVDLALSSDARFVYAKDDRGLVVVNVQTWEVVQQLKIAGGSMVGLAISADARRLYLTTAGAEFVECSLAPDGTASIARRLTLPGPAGKGPSYPCGIALDRAGRRAFICLSMNNSLAEVDLNFGPDGAPAGPPTLTREIPVGVAPYAVALTPDASHAVVSNWGGARAGAGDTTATSAGTPALVDARGVASSGGVSIIDLHAPPDAPAPFVFTGRSASGLAIAPDGVTAYVANANDDTVSVVSIKESKLLRQILVKPDADLPWGSMPNALALSPDSHTLYAALAGNNALAVINLQADPPSLTGLISTAWYPGAVATHASSIFVANIKGVGSRDRRPSEAGYNSHRHRGVLQHIPVPDNAALGALTSRAREDAQIPRALKELERRERAQDTPPIPVPARPGDPSTIQHCVYIIKENRTFDQVFGAIGRGNADPSLCIYGRDVTPNQHKLADEYVLLDNYYCGGVLSADGHSWATEGNVTPYLERSFGGFTRSYTFGDDPLTYSSSGFLWDSVLAAGHSFRNYGEFDYTHEKPDSSFIQVWDDWLAARAANPGATRPLKLNYEHNIGVLNLRRYSNPDYPGWNLDIPDQVRADVFLAELPRFVAENSFPSLVVIYLPNDHTSGTAEGSPTPRAQVADNDLALGRIVEGLTKTPFWPRMAIFINEDDPQDGFDHVDGHRSTCLVVSPYSRQLGKPVSDFYNQSSVVHTIWRILGITAQNQTSALAPLMHACFIPTPDNAPFTALPATIDLREMNPRKSTLAPRARELAEQSEALALDKPDQADEDTLNRILWHAARGIDTPYPAHLAGAHGTGLPALNLRFSKQGAPEADDDDDEPSTPNPDADDDDDD
jgi:DNA-binding beta-propeller fold protein YncE